MFIGMSVTQFKGKFKCNEDCFEYLFDLKWKNGFKCRRCACTSYWKGKTRFHKRCRGCGYDESVTANTVFHKIKIPLSKAFEMAFRISISKKAISSTGLSREFKVSQYAAWFFKRRLQEAVSSRGMDKVDEKDISFSSQVFRFKLQREIGKTEPSFQRFVLVNDDYRLVINGVCSNLNKRVCFANGEVGLKFNHPNIVLQNFRAWINGIHHHCTIKFVKGYLDEFFFRFHFRSRLEFVWHGVIECFVAGNRYYHEEYAL